MTLGKRSRSYDRVTFEKRRFAKCHYFLKYANYDIYMEYCVCIRSQFRKEFEDILRN